MDKLEGLNNTLLLKIAEIWLNNYCNNPKITEVDFAKHKRNLYNFFKDFSNRINDYNVYRLMCKTKQLLQEDIEDIKEQKMNEIRALQRINW